MLAIRYRRRFGIRAVIAALMLLPGISSLQAQTKQLLTWQEDLAGLQSASGDELAQNREAIQQIRNGIEFYLKFHASSKAALEAAPPRPWNVDQIRGQVSTLLKVLETIIKEDPSRPFNLGSTVISVSVEASGFSETHPQTFPCH